MIAAALGYAVLVLFSGLAVLAGVAVVGRIGRSLPRGHQAVAVCVTAVAVVLLPIQVLGFAHLLTPWTVGALEAALALGLIGWAGWTRTREAAQELQRGLRSALSGPAAWLATLAALGLLLYLAVYVVLVPSWGWDALTYHDTIIAATYQNHGFGWIATSDWMSPMVNGYPRNLELFALWFGLFPPRDLLIDGGQLFLIILAAISLAAMARRLGAGATLAWTLGLSFLFVPAVFLNAPSNYNDVGVGALWIAAVALVTAEDTAALPFAAMALGLSIGAKITGLILLAIAAVPLALILLRLLRREGAHRAGRAFAIVVALVVVLGGGSYVRSAVHTGNPVWPVDVPWLNLRAPRQPPIDRPPFGGKNDAKSLWRSWTEPKPLWLVDTRSGGFGRGFLFILLPLGALGTLWLAGRAVREQRLALFWPSLLLIASGVLNPYAWWARFTFGFPAAAILGAAALLALLPRRWLRQGASGLAFAGVVVLAWPARAGFFGPRLPASAWWDQLVLAWHRTPEERVAAVYDHWNPPRLADRDRLVQPGEAAAYDDSVSFIYLLWRPDWQNRVLYLPPSGTPQAWLQKLDDERVRWIQLRRYSPAGRVLASGGWQRLWACPIDNCDVWVRPGQLPAGR